MHLGGIDNNNVVRERRKEMHSTTQSVAGKNKKEFRFVMLAKVQEGSCWIVGSASPTQRFFKVHVVHCCLVSHREREAPRVIHKKPS